MVRNDAGVARRLLIFSTYSLSHVRVLSIFDLFKTCFVLIHRKTATASIELLRKEVKYCYAKEKTSPK